MMPAVPARLVGAVVVMFGVLMFCVGGVGGVKVSAAESRPAAIAPRNTGPAARAHSRYRRGRHGTTRVIRRTPDVMREDAARVKRGDLFGTWSNEYLQ